MAISTQRQRGQVMVMAALLLPVMMAVAAFALDIGTLYAERRALQNAADAAAIAGARALQMQQLGSTSADPSASALRFAALNGVSDASGASCPSTGRASVVVNARGSTTTPTWDVTTSRLVPLTSGAFVGKSKQCVQATAQATASSSMMDIMLSLDTTGSMTLSGTEDFDQLRDAVVTVINQVDPDSSDPTTSKLGIARWAGIQCVYSGSSYVAPCQDDKTLLSPLSANKSDLLKIAAGTQTNCPLPSAIKKYGCPLNHVPYTAPGQSIAPYYTGTKIPNAFTVLNSGSYYSWSASNGGRDKAHKVMVLITDGQNEESPAGNFPQSISDYDRDMQTLATNLKAGKDLADPSDDVEIFVVGFFCAPYSANTSGTGQFCKSKLADTSEASRPCPTGAWPPAAITPSSIDTKLRNLSSSADGTCDHYFPLKKTDSLPELMQTLAKRFAGVRLTG